MFGDVILSLMEVVSAEASGVTCMNGGFRLTPPLPLFCFIILNVEHNIFVLVFLMKWISARHV